MVQALQRMGEQATQAGRIVKRIREFLTRREPQLEPCDLAGVVASGVALLKRDIARHEVEVSVADLGGLPLVQADPVLLEQVVVNLVRNACDALAEQRRPRRVHLTARRAAGGGFVTLSFTDNGPGLNGQSVETLCAPFYSTKAEGMGMGLAICRSIVELHYGALDAAEAPGGGAMFSFSLPVAEPFKTEVAA